jgi:hypothetical protein
MWGDKYSQFDKALEEYGSARLALHFHVTHGTVEEKDRESYRLAKLKVLQLFNEQLTANQKHHESK